MMNALIRLTLLCALFVLPFTQVNADEQHPRVRITTTLGDIVLELDREKRAQERGELSQLCTGRFL